jgi:FtsH-binding integral membrane protein
VSNVFQSFAAGLTAFEAPLDARLAFIRRTYLHLAAAIGLLVAVSWALFTADVGLRALEWMNGGGTLRLLLAFGGLMAATWFATGLAFSARSQSLQYLGLIAYTLVQALFLSPLLTIAVRAFPGQHLLEAAAGLTLLTFGGLTCFVLTTKKDLTFLRPILFVAMLVSIGVCAASWIFGFNLGLIYTGAMILFSAGVILYQTSNLVHRFRTDQHVGASLGLLAGVISLFVQILVLLMQLQGGRRRD